MAYRRTPLVVFAILSFNRVLPAQVPDVSPLDGYTAGQTQQGAPAGSFALSGIEMLNTANNQLSITIPVATVQARGSVSVPLTVSLTPPLWDITDSSYVYNCGANSCQIGWLYTMTSSGWLGAAVFNPGQLVFRSSGDYCVPVSTTSSRWNNVLTRGTFAAADGSEIEFIDEQTNGTPEPGNLGYNRGSKFIADNGSLAVFTASASISDSTSCLSSDTIYPWGTLITRDGTQYTITNGSVTKIEDHNGNYTSFGSPITDSIGRTYTVASGSSTETLQYDGTGGASRTVTVHYAALGSVLESGSPQTYGQLWSLPTSLQNSSQQFNPNAMVSEIDLPDGSRYTFLYDSYGDVAQMTLPTGGVIQYSYANAVNDATTSAGSVNLTINGQPVTTMVPSAYMYTLARALTQRKQILNGTTTAVTKFQSTGEIDWYDGNNNLLAKQTQTISSAGTLPSAGLNYNPPQYNQRTALNYYDAGGSTLLESQTMAYYQPSNCQVNCNTLETLTTNENGWIKRSSYTYDQYNNVSTESDSDWGTNGSPGGTLRVTSITYNTTAGIINDRMLGLPAEIKVYDGANNLYTDTKYNYDGTSIANDPGISGTYHDNTNFNGSQVRGNLTGIQQCLMNSGTCTWLTTSLGYDIAGNLLSVTDANSHTAWFSYADNYTDGVNRDSYAFPTSVTNALGQLPFQANYDYHLGQPVLTADIMGQYTTHTYGTSGFATDRLIEASYANGGNSNYSYPSATQIINRQDQNTSGDQVLVSETQNDGFGRQVESDVFETASQYIAVTHSYDGLGRVASVTNPSRWTNGQGDGLGYATTYSYDGLGRQTKVTGPDGSVTSSSYTEGYTTWTDAAGNSRVLLQDGLGRLTAVRENNGGSSYQTAYRVGADNTLQQVTQGPSSALQTREFYYDSLGRLTGSTEPESGTINYSYDNVGNLSTRTDAGLITTTYSYDALNRLKQIGYNDGKTYTVTLGYDAAGVANSTGQLTSMGNETATLSWGPFSAVGQVLASSETTGGGTYNFSYGYNLAGALTQETYPSGRIVTTGYDTVNRPNQVTGARNGTQTGYVGSVSYFPQGAPSGYAYGNQVWRGVSYNNRLQLSCLWDTISLNTSAYLFTQCPINWGTNNNNGNLQSITTQAGGPAAQSALPAYTDTFGYDGLNRLISAVDQTGSTTNWSRTFAYDQFGNAWVPSLSGVGYGVSTPNVNVYQLKNGQTNNQVVTSPYNAAGDIMQLPPGYSFTYDAENRVTAEANSNGLSANYYYDGAGGRVEKVSSNGQSTVYVYDAFGQMVEEYSPYNTWSKDYVPFNGQVAAIENAAASPCTTCYLSYDYLGTPRMVTDANANVVGRHDYLPFGDEIPGGVAGRSSQFGPYVDSVNEKFTGQYRDTETLNDFFNARYYTAPLMRFLSPDPGNAGADPTDPQTWNGYAYVRGNPLALVDPSGMSLLSVIGNFFSGLVNRGGASQYCLSYSDGANCEGDDTDMEDDSFGGGMLGLNRSPLLPLNAPGEINFSILHQEKGSVPTVSTPSNQQLGPAKNGTQTCPSVPEYPPNASLSANATEARKLRWLLPPLKEFVFYLDVRNGSQWDYKQQGRTLSDLGGIGPSPYQDFGNFNFGVVGAAAGFPTQELLRGAGYAQQQAGTSSPQWGYWYSPNPPYGDDPADQAMIRAGIAYFQNGCVQ